MDTIRTPENQKAFLEALADTCNVRSACQTAGIARNSAYLWRSDDPDFASKWKAALEIGADALEEEAIRRAREGVDEPVFHKGQICGVVRKYSDTLLIFLLKGAKPLKYRDNVDLNVTGELSISGAVNRIRERATDEG